MLRQRIAFLEAQMQQLTHTNQQLVATHQRLQAGFHSAGLPLPVITVQPVLPTAGAMVPPAAAKPPAASVWSEHRTDEGRVYYYNARTGESVWERPADMDEDPSHGPKGPPGANLFVVRPLRRGEYDDFTSRDLKGIFAQFGTVTRAEIMLDRESGMSRGFGFVSFAKPEEADEAIKRLNGTIVAGRSIKVEKTREDQGDGHGGNAQYEQPPGW